MALPTPRPKAHRKRNATVLVLAAATLLVVSQSLVGQADAQRQLARPPLDTAQETVTLTDLEGDLLFNSQEQQQIPLGRQHPPSPHKQLSQEQLKQECERHLSTPPVFNNGQKGITWTTSAAHAEPRLVGLSEPPVNGTLRLWYRTPAKSLEREGLMIGNGRTQALIGGSINVERLVLSEESCWSGGPGEARNNNQGDDQLSDDYRGGNVPPEESSDRQQALQDLRDVLKEKRRIGPMDPIAKKLRGDERHFGQQEAFGEIIVEELRPFEKVEQYRRELDLETGILKVQFTSGGIQYTRYESVPHMTLRLSLSSRSVLLVGLALLD